MTWKVLWLLVFRRVVLIWVSVVAASILVSLDMKKREERINQNVMRAQMAIQSVSFQWSK